MAIKAHVLLLNDAPYRFYGSTWMANFKKVNCLNIISIDPSVIDQILSNWTIFITIKF